MKLNLQVSKEDFYNKYYQSLNGILKLSGKELIILSAFSNRKIKLNLSDKEAFGAKSRAAICEQLEITKFNLNNYIKFMRDRGILVKKDRVTYINPAIYKDINNVQSVDLTITFNIHDNNK